MHLLTAELEADRAVPVPAMVAAAKAFEHCADLHG